MRECRADLVFSIDKTLGLTGIAFQIVIEGSRFRNAYTVIQIEVTSWAEERFVWCDKPDQQAERLIAAVLLQPCECAINRQVVGIDIVIALFRSDLSLSTFLEKRIRVVIGGTIVAEVIVPIALFNAIANMYFAENRYLVAGLAKDVGNNWNVRWQRDILEFIRKSSGGSRVHTCKRH